MRISLCAVVAPPPSRSHLARWVAALVLCGSLLAGALVQEPAPARAAGPARGAGGNAQQYPPNSLNYPPIGAGVDTMAQQPGGGYAIVLGNNCTAEIANCTTYVFPYGTDLVQLVILDRTTLTPLLVQTFAGTSADASTAGASIRAYSGTNPVVVILAALLTSTMAPIDPSWVDVLKLIVPQPGVPFFNGLIANLGGWSAIGVPASSGTPGPVGHLNTGRGDYFGVQHPIGDLKGYMQISPGYSWAFTTGGFASFNTSHRQTAQANTMRINGVDYPSGPLIASSGASCAGGFQVVVVNASTFSPLPPAFNVPVNQTFGTNCGDAQTDVAQINALAGALAAAINSQGGPGSGASEGGALVFLQNIGNPIVPVQFSPQQEHAARVISPLIEQLGGVADAFNKSWWFPPAAPANPGYALAGSTALLADAPSGAQIGVYAPEASSAATGYNPAEPVVLDGLLKRNSLGRYEPVAAAAVPGAAPAFLPATVYQAAQAWPYDGASSASVRGALTWFSGALQLAYDPTSSCYMPSFPNVRAEYCDTNPRSGTWSTLAGNTRQLAYPGESACGCTLADWKAVRQQLAQEMTWVDYIQRGMTVGGASLSDILTDSTNPSFIDLEAATSQVLQKVGMSSSDAAVAGFWVTLASNALKFAANFVGAETGLRPVVGVLSTIGPLGENLASLGSNTSLGRIRATARELPSELSSRFIAATQQFGLFQSIILSDYGKLQALGESTVFQGDPFTDDDLQAQVINGAQLFAYGRLLGAGYTAYGLLPDSYNPGYPASPADYFCGNVGTDGAYPFGTAGPGAAGLSWIGFTYPNLPPGPVPVYGGQPNLLVLGSPAPDLFSVYSTVPTALMQEVVTAGGLGDWDVWFFRHNFTQAGFTCSQLGSPRQPFPLRGEATKVGARGEAGLVRIDTAIERTGPIDLSAARLTVEQVLMESDRGGELVRGAGGSPFLPLALTAARGSRPHRATFKTPPGARPVIEVEVINRDVASGRLAVSLTVHRAALPETAEACEAGTTALLRTRFVLDDRVNPPVSFNVGQPWRCNRSRLVTP